MERLDKNLQVLPLWQRLGWFAGIWIGSVLMLLLVAWIIRWAVKIPV
jgi:Protein of unknown function (DUF2474)